MHLLGRTMGGNGGEITIIAIIVVSYILSLDICKWIIITGDFIFFCWIIIALNLESNKYDKNDMRATRSFSSPCPSLSRFLSPHQHLHQHRHRVSPTPALRKDRWGNRHYLHYSRFPSLFPWSSQSVQRPKSSEMLNGGPVAWGTSWRPERFELFRSVHF